MARSLETMAEEARRSLVLGIGGGGDIVGAISTSRYLRRLGLETLLGGLTWERYVNDPEPGPRRMDEIVDIKRISSTVGLANPKTRTRGGVRFTESVVSEVLGEETLLLDLNQGVQGMISGLNEAMRELDIDLFVGIDVGGDVLADGTEEGLKSMLADSMVLATMVNLDVPAVLGVLGCCTDGELTLDEFNRQVSKIARYGGFLGARGLTPEDLALLDEILPRTKTESSALAVEAARGKIGEVEIQGGFRKAFLTSASAVTFYFDPQVVFERVSRVAKRLVPSKSLEEAQRVLEEEGVPSELTFERNYVWKNYIKRDRFYKGRS